MHSREDKSEDKSPSDSEIIEFILQHIKNDAVLTNFFSTLTKPLSAEILTLKLSSVHDEKLGQEEHNFLGYAGFFEKNYLQYLVRLATPDAINAALTEDPINPSSGTALCTILGFGNEPKTILDLIEKADIKVFSDALFKVCLGVTPFMLALSRNEMTACAVINKVDRDAINQGVKITYFGTDLIHYIINRAYKQVVVDTLLGKLDVETVDQMMLVTGAGGLTPLHQLLLDEKKYREKNEALICSLVSHTSSEALSAITKQRIHAIEFNLIALLIVCHASPVIIEAIFSRLDKIELNQLLNEPAMVGVSPIVFAVSKNSLSRFAPKDINKQVNPAIVAMIKYADNDTLRSVIDNLVDLEQVLLSRKALAAHHLITAEKLEHMERKINEEMKHGYKDKKRKSFINKCATNPPLLNEMVEKMLLEDEKITLTMKALYSLNRDNLVGYLAQHAELCIDTIKNERAYSILFNWQYFAEFEKRLDEANHILQQLIAFSLTAFSQFNIPLPEPLARIIFDYLPIAITETDDKESKNEIVQNKAIVHRVHKEIERLVKNPGLTDVMLPVNTSSFFRKKKIEVKTKPMEYIKKLENAKKAIDGFVTTENEVLEQKSENRLLKPRTLAQLKVFYQEKQNEKKLFQIKKLESDLNQANAEYRTESLKLTVQVFGHASKKNPWTGIKGLYRARQLQNEAKQFGYECRDTPHDGDCFFHAIVDQLALRELSALGASPIEIRPHAIDYILNHLNEYKDFLDHHDGDINDFISRNIEMGIWADHLIISALSRALNINIVIVRSDGADPIVFKRSNPITTLHLGHEIGHHYQSLLENHALLKAKILKDYVSAAALDEPTASALSASNNNLERRVGMR